MRETSKSSEHRRIESLVQTLQQHPTEVLKAERHLAAVKWFEYRFMSPNEANRLFTKTYQKTYSRKFGEQVDVEQARQVSGVHVLTMKDDARERSQLVMARQRADRLGVPYPLYIDAAFDFAFRRGDKRRRFPRPNQLHGNRASEGLCEQFIIKRWNEYIANGLFRVEHPIYLIENYRGLPAQEDFRRFVLDHVREANLPLHRAIQKFTYDRQQVPAECFRTLVSEQVFNNAMEIVESDLQIFPVVTIPHVPLTSTQRWPTCFGMHYALDPSSPECALCPQIQGCKFLGDRVLKEAAKQAGVDDPAGDYKRKMDRERQRRCRANKKKMNNTGVSTRPLASELTSSEPG